MARYAGLTGSPDESGKKSREKGSAGNARVRRGMIQLAWRFLKFQKDSALAQWYRTVTKRRRPPNHDRRSRAQTADCALAHGDDRPTTRGRRIARRL